MTRVPSDQTLHGDPTHTGRVCVDLDAVKHNLSLLRSLTPACLQMAVVKADAYGHGLVPVACAALEAGAQWLGVAQVSEALTLRRSLDALGIARSSAPILTWIAPPDIDWTVPLAADLDVSVSSVAELNRITKAGEHIGVPARIHVKVDTGMSRAGSPLQEFPALVEAVAHAVNGGQVTLVGLWSHLSRADDLSEEGRASTAEHLRIFRCALDLVDGAGLEVPLRHLAATAGILWHPDTHFDLVRVGIGMYGLSPDPHVATSAQLGLRPAMRIETRVTSVKMIEEDTPVSYGGTWKTPTRRWVALVPLGYADGVLRTASGKGSVTIIPAQAPAFNAPQVGRICMDQFVIDLGPVRQGQDAPARVGDRVVLVGDPALGETGADDWACAAGTINYEVVTRVGDRLSRVYTGENQWH